MTCRATSHFNPRSPHGERHTGGQADSSGQAISTHAPRTGSDSFALLAAYRAIPFQPTLPARGATILKVFYSSRCRFQPTLPARGATRTRPLSSKGFIKFQPTLPARGATMPLSIISRQDLPFQPTLPARGATVLARFSTFGTRFQPTLPARGATPQFGKHRQLERISTHAPRTGSDAAIAWNSCVSMTISTHAPRTGSDALLVA